MKKHVFIIADDQSQWEEDYLLENNVDPVEWVKNTLEKFNSTLRPGELPRTYISHTTSILNEKENHDWIKRLDGMSVDFRGRYVDVFYCQKCGITGKRYELDPLITRDSKYRAKKYAFCEAERSAK